MKKYFLRLLSILVFFTVLGEANATSFHGTAVGSWTNVDYQTSDRVLVYNLDDWASAMFYWGLPGAGYSDNLFIFDGLGGPIGPEWIAEIGDPFLLGRFIYRNAPTIFSATVNGLDLSIALNLSEPDGLDVNTYFFDYSFLINNTPNRGGLNWTPTSLPYPTRLLRRPNSAISAPITFLKCSDFQLMVGKT